MEEILEKVLSKSKYFAIMMAWMPCGEEKKGSDENRCF